MEENLEDFDEEFIKLYRMKRIEALRSKMDTLLVFFHKFFLKLLDNSEI